MTLKEVLNNTNIDGKIYTSDVSIWLRGMVSVQDCAYIAEELTKAREVCPKKAT